MTGKRNIENRIESVEKRTNNSDTGTADIPSVVYDMGDRLVDSDGEPVPTDEDGDPIEPPNDSLVILDGEYADPPGVEP